MLSDAPKNKIHVELLAATRAQLDSETGLITIRIHVPMYVWTEILTHRSFARNASSNRAMSTKRTINMGYYTPEVFYTQGNGMESSDTPIIWQLTASTIWHTVTKITHIGAWLLEKCNVAKEQRNRLIAPNKIVCGIVTGTESAWKHFLSLRNHKTADKAMQETARLIQNQIDTIEWINAQTHNPLPNEDVRISIAQLARVSYARQRGKDDITLYHNLIGNRHLSPAEHIAYWTYKPNPSCYTVQLEFGMGWESHRSRIENQE